MSEPTLTEQVVEVTVALEDPGERTLAEDVLDGLTRPFKEMPPKHFYDGRGSELFDAICELPEYYPTRTERSILSERAPSIIELADPTELVELGSGSAEKTCLLLDAMADRGCPMTYMPVDVSETALRASAERLAGRYAGLRVHGLVGDYERHLDALPSPGERRLVSFLGGTLGNFTPGHRRRFLRHLRRHIGVRGHLLLGVDLVKDPEIIEAAYDDEQGITAEFNRNVLHVINRELAADFVPEAFDHVAFFDRRHEWVEMRLRTREEQVVRVGALDLEIRFDDGEEMRTEISAKFTRPRLEADLTAAGLELVGWHTDPRRLFALALVAQR